MSRPRNLLNVRDVLERISGIKEGLDKYGYCPAVQDELRHVEFLARAILRRSISKGRKDVYVEAQS